MELKQLFYFRGIAEAGSFARASERLNVVQPALSNQISKLECQLRTQLFKRHARGVWLTEAGSLLLDHAVRILDAADEARRSVEEFGLKDPEGNVTIVMPTTLALVIAQPLLDRIRALFPGLNVQIVEALSGEINQWYARDRFDLSVLYESRSKVADDAVPLCREDLYLLRPAGGTADSVPTISFSEIAGYPLYHTSRIHSCRQLLDETSERMGIALNYAAEVNSIQILQEMISQGGGFSVFPCVAPPQPSRNGISYQRIVDPGMSLKSYIAPARNRCVSRAQRVVMDLLPKLVRGLATGEPSREPRDSAEFVSLKSA
ncbi:LysR family transcriptional regulator [Terrihabitans sp. B22-R8]|uniref:LysR family transcriptional regulator n=1 Tax=Terrihabitans sp. B22-R8 TaxID=3425128 RepID=UPI00403CDF0F